MNYGEVFTQRWVVETLLDLVEYTPERDLATVRLLEPSCGSGAFLGPIVERLITSARKHGHPISTLQNAIRAYDLQPEHVEKSQELCRDLLVAAGETPGSAAATASAWVGRADFLLPETDQLPLDLASPTPGVEHRLVDVVVGNPPYIRYDDLPDHLAAAYRSTWATMRGRGDIYVGFIERSLRMLRPQGKVAFICADRWMRNQYGAALRNLVTDGYAVEHVWAMHDVAAFESPVSAYPAITVLANHHQTSAVVADTTSDFGAATAASLVKAAQDPEMTEFSDLGVTAHRLNTWFVSGQPWPTGSPKRLAFLDYLTAHFPPLHDPTTGTKVSIGIATGADSAYITTNPAVVEPDRLLPLAMRGDLTTGTLQWQGHYLINPWADDGSLVSLADYPRLAAHLSNHPTLRSRFVAQRNPDSWYRTIDKIQPGLAARPKLLLQDMKTTIHPVLDPGGHYPHHNLYYVTSQTWDIEVLGGLLLSRIAQAVIEAYCVRMRGGTLRFQAQYLKRIRVPRPQHINEPTQEALRVAFRQRDATAATKAAATAYNLHLEDYDLD